MKFIKVLSLIPISFLSIHFVSANEYKFEDIKFDKVRNQNKYVPKDKLDRYIIKGATYATKFVPLLNDGANGDNYKNIMANDGKRLLVDAGYDFVNSTANSAIQSIPFFA